MSDEPHGCVHKVDSGKECELCAARERAVQIANEPNPNLKVELASRNLRITGLEETLRQTLAQLIKVQNADPEIRSHDVETNRVIVRARLML